MSEINQQRRQFITLSPLAFSLLAGLPFAGAVAQAAGNKTKKKKEGASGTADIGILNVALGLEHEAIAAYNAGAALLTPEVKKLAVLFMGHHKAHRDALVNTITKLSGTPVAAKTAEEYATALKASTLKTEADVLKLAAKLEMGAANAYIGVIPSFADKNLAKVAARLAADETMHWTVLSQALKMPLPAAALSFGA